MSSGEKDLLDHLLARLAVLEASAADDLAWLDGVPGTLAEFQAMVSHRRSASRALMKSFEQIEDQLSRVFRLLPTLLLVDANRWYARDYADFAEKVGVLEEAARWSLIVRLRNKLAHDYPIEPGTQFDRLHAVVGYLPELARIRVRLAKFAAELPKDEPA